MPPTRGKRGVSPPNRVIEPVWLGHGCADPRHRGRRPPGHNATGPPRLAATRRLAEPFDHCADVLERCGEVPLPGESPEAAVDRLLINEESAMRVTVALRNKCQELRALHAHLSTEEAAACDDGWPTEIVGATEEVPVRGLEQDADDEDDAASTHSSMPSLTAPQGAHPLGSQLVSAPGRGGGISVHPHNRHPRRASH